MKPFFAVSMQFETFDDMFKGQDYDAQIVADLMEKKGCSNDELRQCLVNLEKNFSRASIVENLVKWLLWVSHWTPSHLESKLIK